MQGVSMMPLLGAKSNIREYVFAEHNWHAQIAHERMVRHGTMSISEMHHNQICRLNENARKKNWGHWLNRVN